VDPKIFADKIFYYTDVISNPKELINLVEEKSKYAFEIPREISKRDRRKNLWKR
jgi:hypothetical protein